MSSGQGAKNIRSDKMNGKTRKFVALVMAALAVIFLCSCAGKTSNGDNPSGAKKTENGVKITATAAKSAQTEEYSNGDFSITIPKGWKVTSAGSGIYHSIRVCDPDEPLNQMFVLLKADCLLHSQAGKDAWQYNYKMGNTQAALFASAVVLSDPSTEGFFKIFSQYTDFVLKNEPDYSGYSFPTFGDFTVTERFKAAGALSSYALGDELLRASFNSSGKQGEGMFAASVVDFGKFSIASGDVSGYVLPQADGGYYMAYNIMAITAAKDTFIEWESLLTECMKTLKYSDNFVNAANSASNEKVAQAQQISQNFNQTMDGIMSSWESRNKSTDIISQKQSDATLGYERVYDTETNEIYRATNGFTDDYKGERYKPVTDDNMYTTPISGYIEKD